MAEDTANNTKKPLKPVTTPGGIVIDSPDGPAYVKALNARYAHPFTLQQFPLNAPVKVYDLGKDGWLHAQLDAGYFAQVPISEVIG